MPTFRSARATPLVAFALAVPSALPLRAQAPAVAPAPAALPTIAAKANGLARQDGFVPLLYNRQTGQLLLELPKAGQRMLLCTALAAGLGSNPVLLDRGADGDCDVARLDVLGNKALVVLENWKYRSTFADNPAHATTVRDAFAVSTVASLPIVAAEGDRVLVDAENLLYRDWLDVAGTLQRTQQGAYALVKDRSTVYEPSTKAFPKNSAIQVALTFEARERAGPIISRVAPDGRAITLRQHLNLVELPDAGYRPREFDPRMSFFGPVFKDYAQPVNASLDRRWIARHRLERVNPADPRSAIRNPIVYYIDRGIPEPLRTATLEGARIWEQAFDAAGLTGGFRVELLPEGADPMDMRYNVVQWLNRNERGFSIGGSLADPRTGQILKGMARMDSHRARTAWNIVTALTGANNAMDTAYVLGRVRQVTAHEIGHTLGMAHNYIASSYGADEPGRGSVMDYPAPRVTVDAQGRIDVRHAYGTGPGSYDVLAIRFGYGIFPPESEADSLRAIVQEGIRRGLLFLTDQDGRPDYASDPRTHIWDEGKTPEEFLERTLAVRQAALARFGLGNLRPGEPVATLQDRFVYLWFYHRWALLATAKVVGGVEYVNAVNGDGQTVTRVVDAARQQRALAQLLGTLAPEVLTIPDTVRALLGPRPFGYENSAELFGSRTTPQFDETGAARTLAEATLALVLQPARLARLVQQHARDPKQLGLAQLADALRGRVAADGPSAPRVALIRRAVWRASVERLIALAADKDVAADVRDWAEGLLDELRATAQRRGAAAVAAEERAHYRQSVRTIDAWRSDRTVPPTTAQPAPPGEPFGDDDAY